MCIQAGDMKGASGDWCLWTRNFGPRALSGVSAPSGWTAPHAVAASNEERGAAVERDDCKSTPHRLAHCPAYLGCERTRTNWGVWLETIQERNNWNSFECGLTRRTASQSCFFQDLLLAACHYCDHFPRKTLTEIDRRHHRHFTHLNHVAFIAKLHTNT